MRNPCAILLMSLFLLVGCCTYAQNIEGIKTTTTKLPADSMLGYIDAKLLAFEKNKLNDTTVVKLLKFKYEIADSLANRIAKISALEQWIKHDKTLTNSQIVGYKSSLASQKITVGDTDEGMAIYFNTLSFCDSIQNDTLKKNVLRSIGIQYKNQESPDLAIRYLNESLTIAKKLADSLSISKCYMTLGNAYKQMDNIDRLFLDTALFMYNESIRYAKPIGYTRGLSGNYNNMANLFRRQNDYQKSLDYAFMALEINLEHGNKIWAGYNYNVLSDTYSAMGKTSVALNYALKSLAIKLEMGDVGTLAGSYESIGKLQAKLGRYHAAYDNLRLAYDMRDSLQNQEKARATQELDARFQNSKKESEIMALKSQQSVQNLVIDGQKKDLAYQQELRAKEKYLIYALGVILVTLIIAIIVFWRNGQQRKKYTDQLQEKNKKIEEVSDKIENARINLELKNQEITDSINYAKRIQAAILPSEKIIKQNLNEAFVVYEPKDIVAGDFYWTKQVGDTVLFAVADCTGHGVPGAMVSVICHNALNTCITQLKLTDPGEILDETTKLVLNQFQHSEKEVRDGMDIALCSFNIKTRKLRYAGANTPLWLVQGEEITKFKANRQPVGNHTTRVKFETAVIPIKRGDMIYLSSDGFVDQFGGEKGKKFLNKRFRTLLVEAAQKSITAQQQLFATTFSSWKGEYEQVDDVCVLGARVDA